MGAKGDATGREAYKEHLRAFCLQLLRFIQARGSDPSFLRSLEPAIQKCRSLKGLRTITGDLLEWSQDVGGEQLYELDSRLSSAGLPTLSAMRSAAHRRFADLLCRERIKSGDDARFLEARLSDVGPTGPSAAEREIANRLLLAYRP